MVMKKPPAYRVFPLTASASTSSPGMPVEQGSPTASVPRGHVIGDAPAGRAEAAGDVKCAPAHRQRESCVHGPVAEAGAEGAPTAPVPGRDVIGNHPSRCVEVAADI